VANETKHVKESFERRVKDQMASVTDIDYAGSKFDSANHSEWIRPRVLGYSPVLESGTQAGIRREAWTFSIDVFAKVGLAGETTHRAYELADLLKAAFDRHDLVIYDWADDEQQEALCYLGRADVTPVPETQHGQYVLQQLNLTWEGVLWT
jgi:hypothetical protein